WKTHWEPAALGPHITAPVCYLNGTNDFFGDPLVAEELLATLRVPHTRHYLPNVDHSLDPAQTRLASAWLRQHLLDGPPVPATPDLADADPADLWWTEDLELPSKFRCWLPGPPPDHPHLAFAHQRVGDLTLSTAIGRMPAAVSSSADDGLRFGLGWRWELGSTRHFSHDASATPPASPGQPWQITPARPDTADPVSLLLHPSRRFLATLAPGALLSLSWSAEPVDRVVKIQLHVLPHGLSTHETMVAWDAATASLLLNLAAFPDIPPDFAWTSVGCIQLTAHQPRAPFTVGPLL
ncbi:MAG: hypothetical protein ABII82_18940, partial [Verrucomicrobiota bacterium]